MCVWKEQCCDSLTCASRVTCGSDDDAASSSLPAESDEDSSLRAAMRFIALRRVRRRWTKNANRNYERAICGRKDDDAK